MQGTYGQTAGMNEVDNFLPIRMQKRGGSPRHALRWIVLVSLAAALAACGETPGTAEPNSSGRWYSAAQVQSGEVIYRSQCAGCHGLQAQGTEDWRRRDAAGNLPPPPLDGSAHAWHHPLAQLTDYVREGGVEFGGTMPGFGASLDDAEIRAAIAYFQTYWTDEVYQRWASMFPPAAEGAGQR